MWTEITRPYYECCSVLRFFNNADTESLETAFANIANQIRIVRRIY